MPTNPYLAHIVRIAQNDLVGLQYDIQNASTNFTQQECLKKMHNIIAYICHHIIQDGFSPERVSPGMMQAGQDMRTAAGTAPRMAPQTPVMATPGLVIPPPPLLHSYAPVDHLPAVDSIGRPPSQVHEVTITAQGTTVTAPGSNVPVAILPPDAHGIAPGSLMQPPQQPRPATPGMAAEIVLPPGGGMTPEVAAALGMAAASNTGEARNITNDQAPVG